MKDKVVIEWERAGIYRLKWELAGDDADLGGIIGQSGRVVTKEMLDKSTGDEWEENAICYALQGQGAERDRDGFMWRTLSEARKALAVAKQAVSGKPWPQWAIEAKSAGWKPPKGWKP